MQDSWLSLMLALVTWLSCPIPSRGTAPQPPPHIIIIVADDLGFNDVGFHGSTQIPTPNIDALAYSGVILNNYYVQPICTPSRSALMTGRHPIHTGLNHDVIYGPQPYGVPLGLHLMPQYLGKLGYTAHHVGKWHLGMAIQELTPTHRGFESHFGYWTGHQDYYDHTAEEGPDYWGYDMRRNMEVARDCYGKYSTDIFTDEAVRIIEKHNASQPLFLYLAHLAVHSANPYEPLQAPEEVVQKFSYIEDEHRRKFAGMLWKLDESVGQVVRTLHKHNMLQNSLILFTTDNGGPAAGFNNNAASNWPLRGVKASVWEGGVRGAGLLWSPLVSQPGRVANQMVHITDWLPTLLSAAGGEPWQLAGVDGVDQLEALLHDGPSPRTQFLVNIDPVEDSAAVRVGDWKLVYNPQVFGHHWDAWFGPSGRNETAPQAQLEAIIKLILASPTAQAVRDIIPNAFHDIRQLRQQAEIQCGPVPASPPSCYSQAYPCLFHVPSDPCEYEDLADQRPDVLKVLKFKLQQYNSTAVPPRNLPWDPNANPKYWSYTWTNWQDFPSPNNPQPEPSPQQLQD